MRRWIRNPRRFAVVVSLVTVGAIAASFGASKLVEHLLALPEGASITVARILEAAPGSAEGGTSTAEAPVPDLKSAALSKRVYADPILRRNIFDSTAVGLTAQTDADATTGERRTDLGVTLVATIAAWPDGCPVISDDALQTDACLEAIERVSSEYGTALILSGEGSDGHALGYGIGDQLAEDATIVKITRKRVYVRRGDGSLEYLDMDGEPGRLAKGGEKSDGAQGAEGITKNSETSYSVESSVLEGALSNLDQLMTQVRATPHMGSDGRIDGYRLSAIRRGSLLQKLGIKNGDVVHAVNGMSLTDPANALGAFQTLQNERSFKFEITRRNQKQTFDYEVR
ncbi:MAG: hypothetical protein JXB39_12935 [Deltaproteobacteria bacterium]|nr:hypothetical protein [Deltaproteobacteria bacterium]